MEAFYQESGRAGRDQLPSRSLLYYGLDDRKRMVLLLFNFVHVLFQFVNRLYLLLSQCWQEFIVSNVKSKKSQSVGSQDSLLKKSLADLNQVCFSIMWINSKEMYLDVLLVHCIVTIYSLFKKTTFGIQVIYSWRHHLLEDPGSSVLLILDHCHFNVSCSSNGYKLDG